jgi:hypothetical protein
MRAVAIVLACLCAWACWRAAAGYPVRTRGPLAILAGR